MNECVRCGGKLIEIGPPITEESNPPTRYECVDCKRSYTEGECPYCGAQTSPGSVFCSSNCAHHWRAKQNALDAVEE